jgi:hypothetical protein
MPCYKELSCTVVVKEYAEKVVTVTTEELLDRKVAAPV